MGDNKMPKAFPKELCDNMVSKLLLPDGPSIIELSKQSGISKSALYRWLNKYKNTTVQNNMNKTESTVSIRPQNWSAEAKLNAVIATSSMTEEEVGIYCRQQGVYAHNLQQWRTGLIEGLKPSANKEQRVENTKLKNENKLLKLELTRKEKALAETSALLILKKKANLIWGDEEDV